MRFLLLGGLILGAALLAALGWAFRGPVLPAAIGLSVLPILCAAAYRPVSLALYAWSWRSLIPECTRPGFGALLRWRWIGEAVNSLLPVGQVGGDLARARLLAERGAGGPVAVATMVADLAIGTFTQGLFGLSGLAVLILRRDAGQLRGPIALGLMLAVGAGSALFGVLHRGAARLLAVVPLGGRLGARWKALSGGIAALDAAMKALARRPGALGRAAIWHLLGWLSQVIETWLVLKLCGASVSWTAALAIESLSSTVRGAAFFIPGGIGVQEGAVVYLCRYLGVPLEQALALAMVKRLREVVVGLPGLVVWAIAERAPLARLGTRIRNGRQGSCADA
jgi:putative membrane protein